MGLGFTEMVIVLVVVLIFFGAGKLPTVMGDLGKGVKSFKQGLREGTDRDPPAAEPERIGSVKPSEPL
jgi:sec-independent protein translocase protein TatA